jgi:tripartite-type tricarboxylate transporter receptor subunit TctC
MNVATALRQCYAPLLMLAAALTPGVALDWPTRPVTIVVPYAPGGNTDVMARLLGVWLGEKLGRPFVVENRGGGSGTIGTSYVARATPDGYTFLFTGAVQTIIVPMLQKVPYDMEKDFVPISIFADGYFMLGIKSALPAKTFPEFIAYAKANPGKLNYGSVGPGGVIHLSTALLAARTGIDMVHVPFNGQMAIGGLVGGTLDVYMGTSAELLPQDATGSVRLIATGTPKRMPQRPDLPAIAEFLPGFQAHSPNGFHAPKGTPPAIIDRMSELTMEAARDPVLRQKLDAIGLEPLGTNPAETRAMIEADKKAYREAVIAAGLLKE